jgi:trigger factor
MSKKRKVIEEVKIPWYQKVKKSTWIMTAIIVAMVIASAGIIIYDHADPYSKINYDKVVKVGKYKGVKGEKVKVSVSDKEVQAEIQSRLEAAGKTEAVKKGKVKDGDTINIDYSGKVDGETFEGGTSQDQDLTIGSGAMIPGFEDALIGKKVGKKYTIDVTFPKDYHATELAGKDAEFDVTINSIQKKVTPDYNEEFIKSVSKFDNKKDYEKSIKKELTKNAKEEAETQLQEDLWAKVLSKTKVKKYPKGMIKEETEIQKAQYQRMADQYGMSPEAMGITEDQYKEMAKESLKEKLALHAIAKKEGIKVKKSDMEDFYNEILESNDMTAKEFEEAAGMSVEDYVETNYYDIQVLRDKVLEFIVDNAKLK